ncbi:MAG TPA: YbjN domain-containing protein [Kofleriaceae bacterium]|jgi:hypothetical protein|nr:YbjN domain-containing protein [Kofleriaceae bacterium]
MVHDTTPEAHRATIDDYLQRFGRERDIALQPLSADGVGHVQRGSAVISIHVLPEQGVLLLLSKVMAVPAADREPLFQRLLELSFMATGDAAFAINKKTDEIFLRCLRSLEDLSYDEFEDLVHTIATVSDDWDDKLRSEFGG